MSLWLTATQLSAAAGQSSLLSRGHPEASRSQNCQLQRCRARGRRCRRYSGAAYRTSTAVRWHTCGGRLGDHCADIGHRSDESVVTCRIHRVIDRSRHSHSRMTIWLLQLYPPGT